MPPKISDANTSRRRKMKEVAVDQSVVPLPLPTAATPLPLPLPAAPPVRYFPLHQQPFTPYMSNGAFRIDLNNQAQHQYPNPLLENLSISAPFKSFTSLLTGADDQDPLPPSVRELNAQIDQIIRTQGDHLKRMLADMQRRQYNVLVYEAEEAAAKKVKEKELELNQVARKNVGLEHREALLQKENQILQNKVKYLEDTTASLRAALQEALLRGENSKVESGGCSEPVPEGQQQDDVESAYVDPDKVEPVMLVCKVCGKRVATMMTWPCRHVSTCKRCDENTKVCPVCGSTKTTSVEVCLP